MIKLLRYLLGYVRFKVTGDFPERLFNQLAANRVSVWDMGRENGCLTACVSTRNYLKMRQYRGKNRVRTKVLSRYGLLFVLKRYRLRFGFAAGLVIYFVLLFWLSGFVWNIEVVGNVNLTEREILSACKTLGLSEGVRRSSIDQELFRTRLALNLPNIAWASVNLEGVKATVNISESIKTEKTDPSACNLIAKTDGVITALRVDEGSIKVKLGQTVTAGQMLVSGITEYKDGTASIGRSKGEIYAKTTRKLTYLATFVQTEKIYIGEPKTKRVISFFGMKIPFYLGDIKGQYETTSEQKVFKSNNMYLPIKLYETVFYKTDIRAYEINEDEAKTLCLTMMEKLKSEEFKNAEILDRKDTFTVTEKGVKMESEFTLNENIAEKELLLIYPEN